MAHTGHIFGQTCAFGACGLTGLRQQLRDDCETTCHSFLVTSICNWTPLFGKCIPLLSGWATSVLSWGWRPWASRFAVVGCAWGVSAWVSDSAATQVRGARVPVLKCRGWWHGAVIPGVLSHVRHIPDLEGRHSQTPSLHFGVDLRSCGCDVAAGTSRRSPPPPHLCPWPWKKRV